MTFDYVLAVSAAVIAASVVILGSFLARYRRLVNEAEKSNRLAKDVWDSANSRFSVTDARIIDLMARTEVISARVGLSRSPLDRPSVQPSMTAAAPSAQMTKASEQVRVAHVPTLAEGTETEIRVLRLLATGPRSSAQIKEEVGRSREHTARMMKMLFDRGLVVRNDRNKPYVYEITDSGRAYVAS